MSFPRTPLECQLPPLTALRANRGKGRGWDRFRQKVAGRSTQNTWICLLSACKSLIVYKSIPTCCTLFSTCLYFASTCCADFPTFSIFRAGRLYLSISLIIKKKRREKRQGEKEGHPRVFETAYFLIHGFLPPSTGFPWMNQCVFSDINHGDKYYG